MISDTLMKVTSSVAVQAKKHSPEIFLGIGITAMLATTVVACKGTIKAKKIIEKSKDDLEIIAKTEETGISYDDDNNPIEYTHEDSVKDRGIVLARTSVDLAKAYGPAVILAAIGITCLIQGHNILQKRNIALVAAYESISEAYKRYQNKVKDLLGETTARDIKYGLKEEEISIDTGKKNKDGSPKIKKEKKIIINKDETLGFSPYARFFDSSCRNWDKDPAYNYTFLTHIQKWCNDRLMINRVLTLNDVYEELGLPRTKQGQVVGWALDNPNSDGYVDFGIYNAAYTPNRDFVNGYEPVVLLDFNVDGSIWEYLPDNDEVNDGCIQA